MFCNQRVIFYIIVITETLKIQSKSILPFKSSPPYQYFNLQLSRAMFSFQHLFTSQLNLTPTPTHTKPNCSLQRTTAFQQPANYLDQYNHIYIDRLRQLQKRFHHDRFDRISKVDGKALICGLLHKKYAKLKHQTDKEFDREQGKAEQVWDNRDEAELGDDSGNIKVHFTEKTVRDMGGFEKEMETESVIMIHDLPHGVVFSARGRLNKALNSFACELITFPRLPPQPHIITDISDRYTQKFQELQARLKPNDELIVLTSGLKIEDFKKLQRLFGARGVCSQLAGLMAGVTGLVICGGLPMQGLKSGSIRELDSALSSLSGWVDIYLMVSNDDTKQPLWPSKPLVKYMLPKSAKQIQRCSNPCIFKLGPIELLGTCGQNITEMPRVCTITDQLDIMQSHLMFNHLAPSCPSTLLSAPSSEDYLVLKSMPNLYFSGGMKRYGTRVLRQAKQSCKIVMVPEFAEGVVLVNPRNLDTVLLGL